MESLNSLFYRLYWSAFGLLSVITAFLIMSYYAVVAGWTLQYTVESLTGLLFRAGIDYKTKFISFAGGYMPLFWEAVVMAVCGWVLARGVSGGIEKFNKILIPGFFLILVVLMIRSLTLPGAGEGARFFLQPDFSKLDAESALIALGAGDLLYAFIAGLVIFPTVFSYGLEPGEGVGLAFMALPAAFAQMPFGLLFGGLFFLLLAIAALTSAISILEVPIAYAMTQWKWSRSRAAVLVSVVCFLCRRTVRAVRRRRPRHVYARRPDVLRLDRLHHRVRPHAARRLGRDALHGLRVEAGRGGVRLVRLLVRGVDDPAALRVAGADRVGVFVFGGMDSGVGVRRKPLSGGSGF
ncbi:hypothetical protein [Paenibacillus flagellatus]|uniref:hypothetical protein n=1 Tax=Paenibacillus flagellatus TaxID=2211139 RepID=UPI00319E72CD